MWLQAPGDRAMNGTVVKILPGKTCFPVRECLSLDHAETLSPGLAQAGKQKPRHLQIVD